MKQIFTAVLHGNKRDLLTSPKALLTEIYYANTDTQFRDHTWINLSKRVAKVQPKNGNNIQLRIQFNAKITEYVSIVGNSIVNKQKLSGVCGITII